MRTNGLSLGLLNELELDVWRFSQAESTRLELVTMVCVDDDDDDGGGYVKWEANYFFLQNRVILLQKNTVLMMSYKFKNFTLESV